jgi:spore germination protein YaaH
VKKIINSLLIALIGVLVIIWLFVEPPLLSPLGEHPFSRFLSSFPHLKTEKIVYGFLPFWNLDSVVLQPELTHLAYFSLTITESGKLLTVEAGETDPGYRHLQSAQLLELTQQAQRFGTKNHVVLSMFDNEQIEAFLASSEAQTNLLREIDGLFLAYPFNGLNLDIEYNGSASPELRKQYTSFVKNLRTHLTNTYDNLELTVAMYAAAASKNLLWEVTELAPSVDYLIVMAYDFHRSSSPVAGPVAPLFEKEASWSESINTYLRDFARQVPTDKLLLGIPFYGYEWQTTSTKPGSFTLPRTGATASYRRIKELLDRREELDLVEHWDEDALAPYLSWVEDGKNYLVYFENAASVTYKLEYVNQLNLAGIAIWSLGYEGDSRDLWQTIDQELKIVD